MEYPSCTPGSRMVWGMIPNQRQAPRSGPNLRSDYDVFDLPCSLRFFFSATVVSGQLQIPMASPTNEFRNSHVAFVKSGCHAFYKFWP